MTARSYKNEYILILITAGIISLSFLLNDINQHIRVREVRIYLQKSSRAENNTEHMNLVIKYRTQKRLYENQIGQNEADIIEMRGNAILAGISVARPEPMDRYRILSAPSVFIINLFRSLIRKGPIRELAEDPVNMYLAIAYYYERNNSLAGALRIYQRALEEEPYDASAAGIILHEGYCNAIMGNYRVAKSKYLTVIRDYESDPAADTALILLRYLEGFRAETGRIMKKEEDSVEKANKLFTLLAYREALGVLDRIGKKAPPADRPKMSYIKGRCLEGLSEKERAIDTYQEIVTGYPNSPYTLLANRRIYLAGASASNGARVKQLAGANDTTLRDPFFRRMLNEESRLLVTGGEKDNETYRRKLAKEEKLHPVLDLDRVASLSGRTPAQGFNTQDPAAARRARNKAPAETYRIETKEGNVFFGTIQRETDVLVIMKTTVGDATIPKSKIASRRKIR